ncbi:MAG: dihydrolipoyl dehydrogenase [Candidatus Aenigmarchaeota archaeon]|nr:dihydrolipoyl dehydrogenase [Candidatus Aenigmarchaeota archaeon]
MKLKTEVVVIGAGPGGYVAAIRLGQLGKQVILVEKDGLEGLGGICMNHGCIPSKALIRASKFFHNIKSAGAMGINVSSVSLDASKLQDWKNGILKKLRSGIDFLCKKNNVKWIKGEAYFESSNTVKIRGNEEIDSIEFDYAIIATGAMPNSLPGIEFDGKNIISYNEILDSREIPKDLLVVGGGYIAVEMATCYAKLGSKVKLVHRRDQIFRGYDKDVVSVVQKQMQKDGVELILNSTISKIDKSSSRLKVSINSQEKGEFAVEVDKILVAVGVKPNSANLGLENTKVKVNEDDFIVVDKSMRSNNSKIFAIGDVATQPLLAHKATREGKIAAEVIVGHNKQFTNTCIPAVIFSDPEIAIAGLTENQAREKGYSINVGKFPFSALGRAYIENETEGFVKIIENQKDGKLIGVTIVGPEASNLISEAALAVEKSLTTEDLINTIHPHPTLGESLMEAAEAVKKTAIHIVNLKL